MKYRTIHSSWLIAALSSAFIIGAYLALHTTYFARTEWFIVAVCFAVVGFQKRTRRAVVFVVISGLILGLWRAGVELYAQSQLKQYIGEQVLLSGMVADDPTYDADGDMRIKVIDISIEGSARAGVVWVSLREKLSIKRSDIVEVEGRLVQGFGTIAAAMYRADVERIVRKDFADVGRDIRDEFSEGIRDVIPEPEASLGAGFLLGQTSELPEKLDNELRLLGLTHIVVASGYNLTILVRFARRFFTRLSRFSGLAISAGLVFGFAHMTGFSPSMTRASLITGLSLLAWYYGRKYHPFVLLPFSAAVTVIINPSYAWGDIGWLLSFTSFIGVIVLSPLIHAYFWGDKKPSSIRQIFIETMSAQLMTLPIIAYVFGQYSSLALIANILVLPFIPLAMLFTFIGGLAGLLSVPFDILLGLPARAVLQYITTVVDKLALFPQASTELSFSIAMILVFYISLLNLMIFLWRRTKHPFRDYNVIE